MQPTEIATTMQPSGDKRIFGKLMPPIMVCALLGALASGIGGWNGRGWVGTQVGPGLGGLLAGAVAGFTLTLLGLGSLFLIARWMSHNRARSYLVIIVLCVLVFLPTWWTSGWNGVFMRFLRFLPLVAVLSLMTWLFEVARKKYEFQAMQSDEVEVEEQAGPGSER